MHTFRLIRLQLKVGTQQLLNGKAACKGMLMLGSTKVLSPGHGITSEITQSTQDENIFKGQ